MTKRSARHDAIRDIIRHNDVKTQRDLVDCLSALGYECTQATVSRDISGLGLVKSAEGSYMLPEDLMLRRMMGEMVEQAQVVGNFIVLHTPSGIASGVAAVLDDADFKGVAGTLAGDDTIFMMCADDAAAREVFDIIDRFRH